MNQPEQYRDDVYPAEERQGTRQQGAVAGGHTGAPDYTDTFRGNGGAPSLRDGFRENGAPVSRELGRDQGRVAGSRLPAGNPLPTGAGLEAQAQRPAPGRALTGPAQGEDPSSMQRAMGLLKQAAPFVARLLPLIDGNIATALGNLFAPKSHVQPVSVDLTPVHNQLTDLQLQQNELRGTVQEQTASMKRVEDQLELVREATDRNTLEQQELIEDLKTMGHKVSMIAVGLSALLVLSVIMNVVLYLYMKRVLP